MKLRRALADDKDRAAALILSSGRNSLDALFARPDSLGYLQYAFTLPDGQFSYIRHLILADDDGAVGIGSCWTHAPGAQFREATIESLVSYFGREQVNDILAVSAEIEQIIPLIQSGGLCIGHLAIDENYRGQGLVQTLLQHYADEARIAGLTSLELDVEAHNESAIQAYQKFGFAITATRKPTQRGAALGLHPHCHMQLLI